MSDPRSGGPGGPASGSPDGCGGGPSDRASGGVQRLIGGDLTLAELRRLHILDVLASVQGDRARAASLLGLPLRTLDRRLRVYGIVGDRAAET